MRIAFGLDGVLADADRALSDLAGKLFDVDSAGPDTAPESAGRALGRLTPAQCRLLVRVVCASDNFWQGLDEIEPGAVARLAAIANERQWEVIFLPRRMDTAGSTPQRQSQEWLVARGFERPVVSVVSRPLAAIVEALELDVVIDSPVNRVLDGVDAAGEPEGDAAASTAMGSVDDCLRRICEIESASSHHFRQFARKLGSEVVRRSRPVLLSDVATSSTAAQPHLSGLLPGTR
ncbi:MAG: hypothetical protein HY824_15845 [Acidobacteria bacterium]|nr:hypothetical protein [Acidobacteriota bacterium]